MQQYLIVNVNLDPTIGSEISKKRPALIISPREMNANLATIIIAPITSTDKASYPTRIKLDAVNNRRVSGNIALDQLRTIDKKRILSDPIGKLTASEISRLKTVLKNMLVD